MKFLFLLPAAVGLSLAGGLMYWRVQSLRQSGFDIDFSSPRHLVTREMELETAAMKNRRAPGLAVTDELGNPVELAPSSGVRPQFVLFIKDACPCSIDAQPIFNRLGRKFAGKVDFYGVIDGDLAHARNYAEQFTVAFPVLPDQDLKIVKGFSAKAGLYSALVARNGHIVKMWPGYSVDMLADMNRLMSEEAAVKDAPFDPQYAPTQKAAGCAYPSW